MSILSDFIDTEREQYMDTNVFAFSLGQASRYYNFLLIVAERCKKTSEKMLSTVNRMTNLSITPHSMTTEEIRLTEEDYRLNMLVQLEIESYYIFAKIFLDRIAQFIQNYFGQEHKISLRSHDQWAGNHNKFRLAKDLTYPQGFSESIMLLKESICDYRDKQIEHERSPRTIRGIMWGVTKSTRIFATKLNPRENDVQVNSQELPALMQAIDLYIQQLITLIELNRPKTTFKLKQREF